MATPKARDRRLSRRADFDRVFQTGRHNSARLLAIRSAPNSGPLTRFGYAIPKRVGPAVTRNLVRRRLRESLRLLPLSEGFDVVITVRPEAAKVTFHALRAELMLLLRRARLLEIPLPLRPGSGQAPPRQTRNTPQ